jgi:hypothetical protein
MNYMMQVTNISMNFIARLMEEITEKVKILGSAGYKGKQYSKEDSSIVFLTDGFYHKNDIKSVVQVSGRYYRINSPLIVELNSEYYGKNVYALIENSIELNGHCWNKRDCVNAKVYKIGGTTSYEWIDPLSRRFYINVKAIDEEGNLISFLSKDGEYHSDFVFDPYSSVWVHKKNKGLIQFRSDRLFIGTSSLHMNQVISKSKKYDHKRLVFQSNLYLTLKKDSLIMYNGELYDKESLGFSHDLHGRILKPFISAEEVARMSAQETTMIIDNNIKTVSIIKVDENFIKAYKESEDGRDAIVSGIVSSRPIIISIDKDIDLDKRFYSDIFKCYVNVSGFDEMFISLSSNQKAIQRIYDSIPDYYKGRKPFALDTSYKNQGGNYLFHEAIDRSFKRSPLLRKTGKIGYTFGVELETSHGIFPPSLIDHYGLKAVGDRSIGALEYVTKPLHGDNGINNIRALANDLSNFCMVDKRCGIHIHVGGSSETESPKFNRRFSVYALKLGLILQKEMFSIVHPERTNNVNRDGLSYCGLIENSYKKISMENYKTLLGKYVYGASFSSDTNSNSRLFRWIQTRYKWLNLINCNSDNGGRSDAGTNSRFQTIEFRLWDGTLSADDIESFILISLAFTRFVDCHQNLIDSIGDKIDLEFVIDRTMRGKVLKQKLINWIEERKQKHLKEKNK